MALKEKGMDEGRREEMKQTRGGGSSVDGPRGGCCSIERQKLQRHLLQDPDVVTFQHTPSPIILMSTVHNLNDGLHCIEGITAVLDLFSHHCPWCLSVFVSQAKYTKSLLGYALLEETYLFPHTPPSSYSLWISTLSRFWSGLSERNSRPELMSSLWPKNSAIYRHSLWPVPNVKQL